MQVELSPRALRDLKSMEKGAASRILSGLSVLEMSALPGPPVIRKVRGRDATWRLRVGEYRALFERGTEGWVILRVVGRKDLEKALRNL